MKNKNKLMLEKVTKCTLEASLNDQMFAQKLSLMLFSPQIDRGFSFQLVRKQLLKRSSFKSLLGVIFV